MGMSDDTRYHELMEDAMAGRLSRRGVLRRGLALGLSIPALGALLAACDDEEEPVVDEAEEEEEGDVDVVATEAETEEAAEAGETPAVGGSPVAAETTAEGVVPGGTPEVEGTPGVEGTLAPGAFTKDNPPEVANAEQASQFSGAQIVYWGDAVGPGSEAGDILARKFSAATGIVVENIPRPESATESFAQYQRIFQAQSADMDCGMIDVIWPGAFAPHLEDLGDAFADVRDQYYNTIIENNTVDGKLVGIPWFGDFGMLFYRTDLLEEAGFDAPPATWSELEEIAQAVTENQRADNAEFTGFVFQGNAYEGLTCNALEWLATMGAGTIVEDGEITLNNEQAIEALNRAQGWVGSIAPPGVTTYQEEDARNVFQSGNAMFMRNWPYAYSAGQAEDSPIADNFDVTPIPAEEGNEHAGTVGGWQLAVNRYSQNKEAAIEFVRYMTSPEVQKWRAIVYSFVPTIPAVAEDPEVIEALPFLATMGDVTRVTRPSRETGDLYNEFSTIFFQGTNEILNGAPAEDLVPEMAEEMEQLIG